VGDLGIVIYLHVTSKGARFVDANPSRESSERAEVELRDYPESQFDPMIPVGTGVHPFA
jgi:hypothetical protein